MAVGMFSPAAFADSVASKEETAKIVEALKDWGCEPGDEIEKEDSGIFELDDAKCKAGQYDIKLSKDFKVTVITAD